MGPTESGEEETDVLQVGEGHRAGPQDLRSSPSLWALSPQLKQDSGSAPSCFNGQWAYNEIRTLHPGFSFEKVKVILAVTCLQNIFRSISVEGCWGSSSKVKGSESKPPGTERDGEEEPREARRVGGRGRPGGSTLTRCQAPSQVLLGAILRSPLKCGETHALGAPWSHRDQNQ